MHALLIDLDGVVYEGGRCVRGAAEALAWLEQQHVPQLFLTNTTSRPRASLVRKLASMGIKVDPSQILTPAVVATRWLRENTSGPVALFVPAATQGEFDKLTLAAEGESATAVVIWDYGDRWSFALTTWSPTFTPTPCSAPSQSCRTGGRRVAQTRRLPSHPWIACRAKTRADLSGMN